MLKPRGNVGLHWLPVLVDRTLLLLLTFRCALNLLEHLFKRANSEAVSLHFGKENCIFLFSFNHFCQWRIKTNLYINIIQHIHWLAVLAAAVAYFALRAIWYLKILFAKKWLALTKIDASEVIPMLPRGWLVLGASFITIMVTCIGLAMVATHLALPGFCAWRKIGFFNRYLLWYPCHQQ